METLRAYLNSLPTVEQEAFARRCGTSIGYLRKSISVGRIGPELAARVERESGGRVRFEARAA